MRNPILVEVTRGGHVESVHCGAVAIFRANGDRIFELGNIDAAVFPRSAIKLIQALPLVESGAADAFDFSAPELALACASHNGEKRHVETVSAMLQAAGLREEALECGIQWPALLDDQAMLIRANHEPGAIHNNCSGKHAGMLAFASHMKIDPAGYVNRDHKVQKAVAQAIEEMTGAPLETAPCGIDGCSIPTFAVPLKNMARAYAQIAAGEGLGAARADACKRLMDACTSEPFMVAGTDRFCTDIMVALKGQAMVKTGAEGVFCAAFPELGLGVALKCDDGATRASENMMANIIAALLPEMPVPAVAERVAVRLTNRRGINVGSVRPSSDYSAALKTIAAAGKIAP
ncbi:MAG: asparaginase [Fimbriimonadaceae bacterium]|nr:asparaginase [Alphaproteobacteria bacterium]